MKGESTFLGRVKRVVGTKVFVEISPEIPSASPIISGRVHRIGQIGSFVRLPLGFLNLYGVVSMVGASDAINDDDAAGAPLPKGQRWLEIQLIGEYYEHDRFQRGVSVFPTLDDEVHVVTEADLAAIYSTQSETTIEIGTHSTSEGLRAYIDVDKLVTRHAAILGSTGSGKSNAVACLVKSLSSARFPNSHMIVIDPHGEYRSALAGLSRVFAIGDSENPLVVPYWMLAFDELAWFLVDRRTGSEAVQDGQLREQILAAKRAKCASLKAGVISPNEITVDSPIPFSLRELWYHFDRIERATYLDMARTQEALDREGNPENLITASFRPPGAGSSSPFKSAPPPIMGAYVAKMFARLRDPRFDFMQSAQGYDGVAKDLDDLLKLWLGHDRPITVFDLAGVPFEVIDLVVGAIARAVFEGMFWGRDLTGIGRQRPLMLVFEEAHSYLPKGGSGQFIQGYASRSVRRILREGRKYGIGGILVSQRPSDLDETILSQCGSFFALRLSNIQDQSTVRAALPDTLAGLMDLLPALRTGEALVAGEVVSVPGRVQLPLIEPRPSSGDPLVAEAWRKQREAGDYAETVTRWRQQRSH